MDSNILQTIKQIDELAVLKLAQQHGIDQIRSAEEYDTRLDEMQQLLIEILRATGSQIFDDEAQWHTYQNVIAALHLADRELKGDESRSLEEHSIPKHAPGNYNPLGELDELDEPTVEQLADRYKAEEVIDDGWRENAAMNMQNLLGGALLDLTMGRFPGQENVELQLLAAMACVDEHYTTQTVLELNPVTRTITGTDGEELEYDSEEMTFKQRREIDAGLFNDV